jgi:four helix bundle protein
MPFIFENLKVYQKAVDFAEQISILTDAFPKGHYNLVDQLSRASLSISLNIAEGNGKFTNSDKKHFFIIARGSAHECVPALEIAKRRGFISAEDCSKLKVDLEEVAKMISGLLKRYE